MTLKQQAEKLAAELGVTLRDQAAGSYLNELTAEAPAGYRFDTELHEVVAQYDPKTAGDKAGAWRAILADLAAGVEPCTDPACEWCHPDGPAPADEIAPEAGFVSPIESMSAADESSNSYPDDPPLRTCACGHRFPFELGKYGCPNCNGDAEGERLDAPTGVRVGIVVEHPGGITADLAAVTVNAVVVSKRAGSVYDRQRVAEDLAAHLRAALHEWTAANPGLVWDDYAGLFTVDPSRLSR